MINRSRVKGERVYVVVWPMERIVKVGYTNQMRWRAFLGRGAELAGLTWFDTCKHALDYEGLALSWLADRCLPAFGSRNDAAGHLPDGAGWLECYTLPALAMLGALPQPSSEQCNLGPTGELLGAMDVRTYARTNERSLPLSENRSACVSHANRGSDG